MEEDRQHWDLSQSISEVGTTLQLADATSGLANELWGQILCSSNPEVLPAQKDYKNYAEYLAGVLIFIALKVQQASNNPEIAANINHPGISQVIRATTRVSL